MKPRYIFIAAILGLAVAAFLAPAISPSPLDGLSNWGLTSAVLVSLAIGGFFFEFERRAAGSKEIALVAIMGAVSAVVRIPFAAVPSVQPSTYLIICTGYVFGAVPGFMVGALTALVSNLFLGQGPWTVYQMFAWGLVGVAASYLGRFHPGRRGLIIFGIVSGYVFGAIMNLWFWASLVYPLTPRTFLVAWLSSIWFDTAHAIGNAVFLGLFGTKTITILERFRSKFHWGVMPPSLPP